MTQGIAQVSELFKGIQPSAIRTAQIKFRKRNELDKAAGKPLTKAINVAIGNVSLKTHPLMIQRYLNPEDKDLRLGDWRYSETVGRDVCNETFINIVTSFLPNEISQKLKLFAFTTDGSSTLMKTAMLGVCGDPGSNEKPLLVIDPIYTNYLSIAKETGRSIVSVRRTLQDNGKFTDVSVNEVEEAIKRHKPGALVIIPYDNPSGQLMRQEIINEYAKLCLKYKIFLISDEAYRGLYYTSESLAANPQAPTVWNMTDKEVPGIEEAKIRISLETMSKVFNACGLRMGALVTDNQYFQEQSVAFSTTYLCASVLDQHIVESLHSQTKAQLQSWVAQQRDYYGKIMKQMHADFNNLLPGIVVSLPESSIYSVVDVRKIAKSGFNAKDFVDYCANFGSAEIDGEKLTLLVAPMAGFYKTNTGEDNPGTTQMRIALVAPEKEMLLVPRLFAELFKQYEAQRD
ncbi:pyridoxal phosphate-dependent aminotransferase [Candidatus Woesearchaeota archaeon]|nr:pyridoxal phosphate-dependent aminotransferase [Candidatus Woesearchaeota archaeon]